MRILGKFLSTGAVAKLLNNTYLVARNAADSADISIMKVNASDRIQFASLPQSSATPATADDFVNKAYADGITGAVDSVNGQTGVVVLDSDDIAEGSTNKYQKTWNKENLTLNGTDITNQYKDLAQVIIASSLDLAVNGVLQVEGSDYTISLTGGVGGKTRLTFAGDLATGGPAALISGDILRIKYQY